MKKLFIFFLLVGCGPEESSSLKEPINNLNDPKWIPGSISDLEYRFNKLPDSARVDRLWGGHWWPMSEGGTASTRYGSPSPLAKYDQATGAKSAEWEIANARTYGNVSWAGHCNGLSASGIMVEEPTKPAIYKNVLFSVTDVKALLTEAWQGSGYIIGDRCDRSRVTYDQFGRIQEAACRDVNPGTLHIALANYLGLFGKAIIADMDNSEQVWNYPIEAYKIIEKRFLTKDEATRIIQRYSSSTYAYNENAIDFVYVKNEVNYLSFDSPKIYEYVLELNLAGNVIGGEWVGGSKTGHPDFIWRPTDPRSDNPNIDVAVVTEIYRQAL